MNIVTKYFWVWVVIIALFMSTSLNNAKRKKKKPPQPQTLYISRDPNITLFLQFLNPNPIRTAEQDFFIRLEGSKYAISFMPMNWFKAYHMCRRRGGYLLDVDNTFIEAGNRLLKMRSPEDWRYWTVITSLSSNAIFRNFGTGEDISPNRWAPGEPKVKAEGCVIMERSPQGFSQKAVNCRENGHALCEIMEKHVHGHENVDVRTKNRTSRMKNIFSWR